MAPPLTVGFMCVSVVSTWTALGDDGVSLKVSPIWGSFGRELSRELELRVFQGFSLRKKAQTLAESMNLKVPSFKSHC